jgi:DNA-directed RNA polymerase subunit RPC12/RpoP
MGIKWCRKCSNLWKSKKINPVACPKCKSRRWFREKLPTKIFKYGFNFKTGESRIIILPKDKLEATNMMQSLRRAKAKNPRLVITPRAEGLLVELLQY